MAETINTEKMKKQPKRKSGYYWVKCRLNIKKEPALYFENKNIWFLIGSECLYNNEFFTYISPTQIKEPK